MDWKMAGMEEDASQFHYSIESEFNLHSSAIKGKFCHLISDDLFSDSTLFPLVEFRGRKGEDLKIEVFKGKTVKEAVEKCFEHFHQKVEAAQKDSDLLRKYASK